MDQHGLAVVAFVRVRASLPRKGLPCATAASSARRSPRKLRPDPQGFRFVGRLVVGRDAAACSAGF